MRSIYPGSRIDDHNYTLAFHDQNMRALIMQATYKTLSQHSLDIDILMNDMARQLARTNPPGYNPFPPFNPGMIITNLTYPKSN